MKGTKKKVCTTKGCAAELAHWNRSGLCKRCFITAYHRERRASDPLFMARLRANKRACDERRKLREKQTA